MSSESPEISESSLLDDPSVLVPYVLDAIEEQREKSKTETLSNKRIAKALSEQFGFKVSQSRVSKARGMISQQTDKKAGY